MRHAANLFLPPFLLPRTHLPLSSLFLLLFPLFPLLFPPLQLQTLVEDLGAGPRRPERRHHLRRQRRSLACCCCCCCRGCGCGAAKTNTACCCCSVLTSGNPWMVLLTSSVGLAMPLLTPLLLLLLSWTPMSSSPSMHLREEV